MTCKTENCGKPARRVTGLCRPCYGRQYREKNRQQLKARHKEYHKKYYAENRDAILEKNRKWFRDNPERRREMYKEWCAANPEKARERNKRLRALCREYYRAYNRTYGRKKRVRQATPKWLTDGQWEQIRNIYETRPAGYHVDHIVPIQGKDVCGLHVPWNLQHLPAHENIKKSNKEAA